jgi:diacylglycerol kinase family enzyme
MREAQGFLLIAAGSAGLARILGAQRLLAGRAGVGRVRATLVDDPAGVGAALRSLQGEEIPVAVGGDGTVNLLARALLEAGLAARPFGLLALGTGNAIAYGVGVARARPALAALLAGEQRPLDVARTSHPAWPVVVASISVGLEARYVHRLAAERDGADPPRRIRYMVRAALAAAQRGPVSGVALELDGRAVFGPGERLYNAGLYLHPTYGFGARVLPSASPWDGIGEAVVRRRAGAYWRTLLLGARGSLAPLPWRRAVLDSSLPVQVDGEPAPAGRYEVELVPRALQVLVPPRSPERHHGPFAEPRRT